MRFRAVGVGLALFLFVAFAISAGAAAPEGAEGWLSLRVLGLTMDDTGAVRLVPVARQYTVYTWQGDAVGTLVPGHMLSLPASAEGTSYTLKATGAEEDGFSADDQVHTAVLFPGMDTLCQPILQSLKGFFAFTHVSAADGAPVPGGTFALYDEAGALALSFCAGEDGSYAPQAPLPQGRYSLRMETAADGYQYTDEEAIVDIIANLANGGEPPRVTLASRPVPEGIYTPEVSVIPQALPSLFAEDAHIDFALSVLVGDSPLPLGDVSYTYVLPEIAGLRVVAERHDGLSLVVPRRFALGGIDEIAALSITGTVRYAFVYRVSRTEEAAVNVQADFSVVAATFEPLNAPPVYAVAGWVTDEGGAPLAGIPAQLIGIDGGVIDQTETDPVGAYAFASLPDGAAVRLETPDGYAALWTGHDATILPVETVRGKVVSHGDLGGEPISLFYGVQGPIAPDADGSFVFTGAFAQGDSLRVDVPEDVLTKVTWENGEHVVSLYQPAALHGRVAGHDGTPVPGAQVRASADGAKERTAETDADGVWRIDGLFPGMYTVSFSAPEGYVAQSAAQRSAVVEAGDAVDVAGIGMMPPAAIDGVVMESGMPVAGVAVVLEPGGRLAVTNSMGRFAFEGLYAGVYTLAPELPNGMLLISAPSDISLEEAGARASALLEAASPARLSGRIWHDENDDGLYTSNESGLADAMITLLYGDAGDAVAAEMATGKDGLFALEGIVPGVYRVAVRLPEAMIFAREAAGTERLIVGVDSAFAVSEPLTLASGGALDGITLGAIEAGSIFGRVWQDESGEGLSDADESPVSGVTVEIWRDGALYASAVTDETGSYRFSSLRPGEYSLRMSLEDGLVWAASDGGLSGVFSSTVSVRRWRPHAEVNAGVQRIGSLAVRVWLDADADGHDWNESGYQGAALSLIRQKGGGGQRVAQAVTDADGRALFGDLVPGTYRVEYAAPIGWEYSAGAEKTHTGATSSEAIVITNGASAQVAAGITALGQVEGVVFGDANYDGLRGDDEGSLFATVALLDPASGAVLREAGTDAWGNYRFDGLMAGRYVVRFTLSEGYRFTKNRTDAPSFRSGVPETEANVAQTATLYLPMGETLRVDAGGYNPAVISGALWHDSDNTGKRPVGGAPLSGVAVSLLSGGETLRESATDQNGLFTFEGLTPGEYVVGVTLPKTMSYSLIADAADSMIQGVGGVEGFTDPFVLRMGGEKSDISIGAVYTGTVSGQARDALTGAGIPGAEVRLLRDSVLLAQTATDDGGAFSIEGIRPGDAHVTFTPPEGYRLGEMDVATIDILLEQGGEAWCEMEMPPEAVVQGLIWLDAGDADGQQPPLADALITLRREDGGAPETVAQMRTGADGRFYFGGLSAGEYSLAVQPPDNAHLYDDSVADPFPVMMGETYDRSFSAYYAAQVGGMVFEDVNSDAAWNEGEPLIKGTRVALLDENGETIAEGQTDEQGRYAFGRLWPREYFVRITPPDGYLLVAAQDEPLRLEMGDRLTLRSTGVVRAARIGDLVWLDENGNGLQETAEPGVSGITVTLLRVLADGTMETDRETVTDVDGRYRFDDVLPGKFRVVFTLGDEYLPTQRFSGLGQINSKIFWPAGQKDPATEPFDLPSGALMLTIDAGIVTRQLAAQFGWIEGEDGEIGAIEDEPLEAMPVEAGPIPAATVAPQVGENGGQITTDDPSWMESTDPAWAGDDGTHTVEQEKGNVPDSVTDMYPWLDDIMGDTDPWMDPPF